MEENNPLARRAPKPTPPDPMLLHAKTWRHVSTMAPHEIAAKSDQLDYVLPIMGELAGNPNVKAKDVIKAAAQASADGKIEPSEAVKFISAIPPDPDALRPWLKGLYAANLSAQVHMKAAMLGGAQQPSQTPRAPVEPPPTSMTPGAAP